VGRKQANVVHVGTADATFLKSNTLSALKPSGRSRSSGDSATLFSAYEKGDDLSIVALIIEW